MDVHTIISSFGTWLQLPDLFVVRTSTILRILGLRVQPALLPSELSSRSSDDDKKAYQEAETMTLARFQTYSNLGSLQLVSPTCDGPVIDGGSYANTRNTLFSRLLDFFPIPSVGRKGSNATPLAYVSVSSYTSANALPETVWELFRQTPRQANIMFAHALKIRQQERDGQLLKANNLWLTCSVKDSPFPVDFVLSCTEGPMGAYPIFIFTPHPFVQTDLAFAEPCLQALARTLYSSVELERVYSVFAFEPLAQSFSRFWQQLTGICAAPESPYYAAKLTYCTKDSFIPYPMTNKEREVYELRLAKESDILDMTELCHGFSLASEPFVLTHERAMEEAKILVHNRQVWVHRIKQSTSSSAIASVVALTRDSESVTAITKVFTSPQWRKRGCAERLVRFVCEDLLFTQGKECVVLYVGHNNDARSIYHRVGFVGLDKGEPLADGIDSWLEIGFDRNKVNLGFW